MEKLRIQWVSRSKCIQIECVWEQKHIGFDRFLFFLKRSTMLIIVQIRKIYHLNWVRIVIRGVCIYVHWRWQHLAFRFLIYDMEWHRLHLQCVTLTSYDVNSQCAKFGMTLRCDESTYECVCVCVLYLDTFALNWQFSRLCTECRMLLLYVRTCEFIA